MDMADQPAAHRVVEGLLPLIAEGSKLRVLHRALLDDAAVGVVAPVGVEQQDPVRGEGSADLLEIGPQGGAAGEQPVTEVQGQHQVQWAAGGGRNVLLEQLDARALVARECRQMVALRPVQHLRVPVDPDGAVGGAAADPLAAHRGGPAKVLAQPAGTAAPQFPVGVVDEIHLRPRVLHRTFVETVAVGGVSGWGGKILYLHSGWAAAALPTAADRPAPRERGLKAAASSCIVPRSRGVRNPWPDAHPLWTRPQTPRRGVRVA